MSPECANPSRKTEEKVKDKGKGSYWDPTRTFLQTCTSKTKARRRARVQAKTRKRRQKVESLLPLSLDPSCLSLCLSLLFCNAAIAVRLFPELLHILVCWLFSHLSSNVGPPGSSGKAAIAVRSQFKLAPLTSPIDSICTQSTHLIWESGLGGADPYQLSFLCAYLLLDNSLDLGKRPLRCAPISPLFSSVLPYPLVLYPSFLLESGHGGAPPLQIFCSRPLSNLVRGKRPWRCAPLSSKPSCASSYPPFTFLFGKRPWRCAPSPLVVSTLGASHDQILSPFSLQRSLPGG